ncbi:MAG: hypothetical protein ACTSU2_08200 [Promethearchaeota archaeon]
MSDDYRMDTNIDKIEVYTKVKKMPIKYGKVVTLEIKKRDPFIPPSYEKKLREQLPRMKTIIPNEVAIRNDIRVSTIKKLIKDLEKEGLVKRVSSSRRLKIYTGTKAKK